MKNLMVSTLLFWSLSSCQMSQDLESETQSKLTVLLPEAIYLNHIESESLEGSLCYFINVKAADIPTKSHACFPEVGIQTDLLSPSTEIELSIPSGLKRKIELWGYQPAVGETCQSLGSLNPHLSSHVFKSDRVYRLGEVVDVDLTRSVESIGLTMQIPTFGQHYAAVQGFTAASGCPISRLPDADDDAEDDDELIATPLACPTGYILIPALAGYSADPFCVAKYEMKNVSGTAISQADNTPWTDISRNEAIAACSALGSRYALISNAQWQTIARNIANVAWNWSSGLVASSASQINMGHTDGLPNEPLAADDSNFCYNTDQDCSATLWNLQRRVHQLSNQEYIWDFSGNVWEWVREDVTQLSVTGSLTSNTAYSFDGLPSLSNIQTLFGPASNWSSNLFKLGKVFIGDSMNMINTAIARGGGWTNLTNDIAGIFTVSLKNDHPETTKGTYNGFRCVYQ